MICQLSDIALALIAHDSFPINEFLLPLLRHLLNFIQLRQQYAIHFLWIAIKHIYEMIKLMITIWLLVSEFIALFSLLIAISLS